MTPPALIVSPDPALANQVQEILYREFACQSQITSDYAAAAGFLSREGLTTLLIDLGSSEGEVAGPKLLQQIAFASHRRPAVIGMAPRGMPREWSVLADSVLGAFVTIPFDRTALINAYLKANTSQPLSAITATQASVRCVQAESLRFVTHTPELFPILELLERVAVHDVTLLLIGETGSGKTTLAQLIHQLSHRRHERFSTVACGALPADLIESELFGHVRGAFTGAERSKLGRFEAAERGTLLLDEIDVLGPKEQAKLLRVIETGEFEPVGSSETRKTQARMIVASNVDLKSLVERNLFRSDLYYRLNVLEFHLPPLRQRPLDIVPMALEFVDESCRQHGIHIDRIHPDFFDTLKRYDWPGNIRELKNHVRRAVLFARNRELLPADLALNLLQPTPAPQCELTMSSLPLVRGPHLNGTASQVKSRRLAEQVALSEREILEETLRAHNYKRAATARSLGISRVGLYKKMRKYGMLKTDDPPPDSNGHGPPTAPSASE